MINKVLYVFVFFNVLSATLFIIQFHPSRKKLLFDGLKFKCSSYVIGSIRYTSSMFCFFFFFFKCLNELLM